MKIVRIETFTDHTYVSLVRVTAEDGAAGWGQIAPSNADISATVLHRQVARHVLGRDEAEVEAIAERAIIENYKFPWSYVSRAVGGIDTALWDLRGKRAGKGVCELLGGTPGPIAAYGSSMRRDITPADEAQRLVRLRAERGYGAFKVRIGMRAGNDADQWPGRTEELLRAVRNALGDGVRLLVDANSCYTPRRAIEVGRMLEDFGVCHFEEPCPWWEYEWTAQVAAALDVPVAGGEQDNHLPTWRRMIAARAMDICQPDVCYVGGLSRALQVAKMAQAAGLPVVPHSANRSMLAVFTLHLLAAIPNAGDHMELSIEPGPWAEGIFEPRIEAVDGRVPVPAGPGWGVTVDPAWLAKAEHAASELES